MTNTRAVATAIIMGVVLVWLAQVVTGVLAALPIPASFWSTVRGWGWNGLASFLYMLLVIHIPIAIFSAVVSWGMFRLLGRSTLPVVLACVGPWFVYVLWNWLSEFSQFYAVLMSSGWMFPLALLGTLSLPAGVWLGAYLVKRQEHAL